MKYLFIIGYAYGAVHLLTGSLIASAGWTMICLAASHVLPFYMIRLSGKRIRKMILEEESWIGPIAESLRAETGIRRPEIYILEQPGMNAYVIGRSAVVLSRQLVVNLDEKEIKAVLAHEFGHIKDRDAAPGIAFAIAGLPLQILHRMVKALVRLGGNRRAVNKVLLLVTLLAVLYFDWVILFITILVFYFVYPATFSIVLIIWFFLSRRCEFRQDKFVHYLGFGRYLKSALLKVDSLNSGNLVSPWAQLWTTHPMLYQRIRRLEWLEGQRRHNN